MPKSPGIPSSKVRSPTVLCSTTSEPHQFWLRRFVQDQRANKGPVAGDRGAESTEIYVKRACGVYGPLKAIDAAAEGGLVGREPLARLERELAVRGLRIK